VGRGGGVGVKIAFVIPGPPRPKQRARRGRNGHWYTPVETREYERRVKVWAFRAAYMHDEGWPMDAAYRVEVVLYMPDKRTRDGDNVLKSIQDGANGVLWRDDRQVVETTVRKDLDRDDPRAEVVVEVVQP
jgi:crossover junction endodeoxyribonuclease RusA